MRVSSARIGDAAASRAALAAVPLRASRSRRRRRVLGGAIAVAVAGVLLALLAVQLTRRSPVPRAATPTALIIEGPVVGTLPATGVIERESTVRVGSPLPGQVVEVRASVGDRVERGQVLARLDNLEQRAALDGADAQLTIAELQMTKAQAVFLNSLRASGDLRDEVPLDELLEGAAGEAQLDLITAAAYAQKQEAAVALARRLLARRVIRAPVAGVIVDRSVARGESLVASPPGPPLFVIDSRPGRLLVRAEIPEEFVGRVQAGPARLLVPAFPDRSFLGEVIGTAPSDQSSRVPASPTRRRHEVMLAVDNSDGTLGPGLSATAELPMTASDRALNVPVMAVDRVSAGTTDARGEMARPLVWLVHGTAPPTPVAVDLGVGNGRRIEVRGPGLQPGQVVKLLTTTP